MASDQPKGGQNGKQQNSSPALDENESFAMKSYIDGDQPFYINDSQPPSRSPHGQDNMGRQTSCAVDTLRSRLKVTRFRRVDTRSKGLRIAVN